MEVHNRSVGILLPATVIRRILLHKRTNEVAVEYASAAKRMNLEAVLFSINNYDPKRGQIRGYVWREGKWLRWKGPLPRVVHNRILPMTRATVYRLKSMHKELGSGLFNPLFSRDKWHIEKLMIADAGIKQYLPVTWQLDAQTARRFPKLVRKHKGIVIKPRRGSLGLGIVFVKRIRGQAGPSKSWYKLIHAQGKPRVISKAGLLRYVRRLSGQRYIAQAIIPLMKYEGRRCDVRVPVQRDGGGQWKVLDPTIKQATKHEYLTNIAQGGKAFPFDAVIQEVFGFDRLRVIRDETVRLALAIARRVSKAAPHLADLGLDIGIDAFGKPWLIEVNLRDQRAVPREAGDHRLHAELHHNPVEYANWLLQRLETQMQPEAKEVT